MGRTRKDWLEWFRVDRSLATHPKLYRLCEAAGVDRDTALGRLVRFWSWCAEHAPSGRIDDLASRACVGESGLTLEQLQESGFVDRANGHWVAHHFYSHNMKQLTDRERKRNIGAEKSRRNRGEIREEVRIPPVDGDGDGDGDGDSTGSSASRSPELPLTQEPSGGKSNTVRSRALFARPTLAEVTTYCAERRALGKPAVNPEAWFAFYESNGWRVGKNPMKSWKGAIVTWENNGLNNGAARRPGYNAKGGLTAEAVHAFAKELKRKEAGDGKG